MTTEPPGSGERTAGTVFDPRIDRLITWGLGVVATGALTVGAAFYKGTQESFIDLNKQIVELRIELATVKVHDKEIAEMKAMLRDFEGRLRSTENRK